jgi:hypothetical protein
MPVKSPAQFRLMEAAAHGELKGAGGPSSRVANKFLNATPHKVKSNFAKALFGKRVKK